MDPSDRPPGPLPAPPLGRSEIALELTVPAAALSPLRRHLGPVLRRARPIILTWHDRDAIALSQGLAVVAWQESRSQGWRAEALRAPIGAPPRRHGEASTLAGLDLPDLPDGMTPVQGFAGRLRDGTADGVALRLVAGSLGDAAGPALARLNLVGTADATVALAHRLVAEYGLEIATRSLAAEALALAGMDVPGPPLGAPILPEGLSPGDCFAHAAMHLIGVVLHHAPAAAAGETGEPVHQIRVALRRLRSLTGLFRDAIAGAEVAALRPALKTLATALGPARDLDVFLAGTGRALSAAFPDETVLEALIAAATQRRAEAYAGLATLLSGPALHGLALQVAVLDQLRPWPWPAGPPDTMALATTLLARCRRQVVRRKADPAGLSEDALHQLRLKAKCLRYAAEVFAPLCPGGRARRFLKHVAALQEALGRLNDGVVAAGLMHDLAFAGGTGLAGGMVRGYVAAHAGNARTASARAWRRLRKAELFWA